MNLKLSNRPVRTRMPGGVAGAQPMKAAPYADTRRARETLWKPPLGRSIIAQRSCTYEVFPGGER